MDRKAEYLAKLRDPRWQKMRLEVLSRDEFTCQVCFDSASTLHVHHRWYVRGREPWDIPARALVTLCESCHERETEMLRDACDDAIIMMKQSGAMALQMQDIAAAFSASAQWAAPLGEYEWSVIAFAIRQMIESLVRVNNAHEAGEGRDVTEEDFKTDPYFIAMRAYQEHCKRVAQSDATK